MFNVEDIKNIEEYVPFEEEKAAEKAASVASKGAQSPAGAAGNAAQAPAANTADPEPQAMSVADFPEDAPLPRGVEVKSADGLSSIIVAKNAGFCFGVKRAVDKVYSEAENGEKPIYTYGPIIHNETVVEDLERRGVKVLNSPEELAQVKSGTVIIRSHGVSMDIYQQIERQGLKMVDATCPFVKKIHRLVKEYSEKGYEIIIIGSADHPEVVGIRSYCRGPVTVIETEEDASGFRAMSERPICIVSQTTFNLKKFDKLVEILRSLRYDTNAILNTICNATEVRQSEARSIAGRAKAMIVIGGKHSSNTQKLTEICKRECIDTYFVQTFSDLNPRLLPSRGCVGITAGASTPNNLIEEVSKECRKIILNRC